MSKIGVGVGEDFPVDDGKPREDGPRAEGPRGDGPRDGRRDGFQGEYRSRDDDADYAARREAYRNWREQRREWKRQWRDEWRARRDEFRDQVRGSYHGRDGYRPHWGYGHPFFWGRFMLWPILAVVVVIALISFAFSHIYFILGGLVLLALFAGAFHRGFDPFDLPRHRYDRADRPAPTPPQPPQPPAETPRDSAH